MSGSKSPIKRKRSSSFEEDFLKQLLGSGYGDQQQKQRPSKQVPPLTTQQLQQFQKKTADVILRGRQGRILDLIQGKVEKVVENIPSSVIKEAMKKSQKKKVEYFMLLRAKPLSTGLSKHDHKNGIEVHKVILDKTKPYPMSMSEAVQAFHVQHPELFFMDGIVAAPIDYLSSSPKKSRR